MDAESDTNDTMDVCRACLDCRVLDMNNIRPPQKEYVSLSEPSLLNMFSFCTSINIERDDVITKRLCLNCLTLLEKLFKFKNQCIESDYVLRGLPVPKIEINIDNIKIETLDTKQDISMKKEDDEHESTSFDPFNDNSSERHFQAIEKNKKRSISKNVEILKMGKKLINKKIKSNLQIVYSCPICGKGLSNLKKKENHKVEHFVETEGFYNCDFCNSRYKNIYMLKKHRWKKHFEKPKTFSTEELTCKICGKECKRKGALKTHELSHDNINKICPVCGITTSSNNFKYHKLTHSEKKIACNLCDNMFYTKASLKKHYLRKHEPIKAHICTICSKGFGNAAFLKEHYKVHSDERPFSCDICLMCFRTKVRLIVHMRTHTGEKPFICGICDHAFTQQGTLQRHKTTHDNVQVSKDL